MALADAAPFAVAAWTLDEASGTRADQVGSNDLADNNTVGSGTGKFGNAADFDKSNSESLSISDNADLSAGDVDLVIRVWVKIESLPGSFGGIYTILGKTESTEFEYRLFFKNDFGTTRFQFGVRDVAETTFTNLPANSFGNVSAGTWYLIHCWHDSVNNELGIAVNTTSDTTSYSGGVLDEAFDFRIGCVDGTGEFFDGLIDDVVILKGYILDSDERSEDYNSGTGVAFADWAAASGTFTATAGATIGAATSAASATFAPGTHTASAVATTGGTTAAASAGFTPPTFTATAAANAGAATGAASATFDAGTFTASAAATIGAATSAASATFTAPIYTATAAATVAAATSAAAATFATETFTASAAATSGAATSAAAATFDAGTQTATGAATSGAVSATSAATFTPPSFTATISATCAAAIAAAAAQFAEIVTPGPYRVLNSQAFVPGGVFRQFHLPGAEAAQALVPGADSRQYQNS